MHMFLIGAALGIFVGGLLGARWAYRFFVRRVSYTILMNDPSLHTVKGAADASDRVKHLIGHGLSTDELLQSISIWEDDLVEQAKEIGARIGSAVG